MKNSTSSCCGDVYFQTNPSTLIELLSHISILLACHVKIYASRICLRKVKKKPAKLYDQTVLPPQRF